MTKYYTMKECFDACGDDDIPYVSGKFNDVWNGKQYTKAQINNGDTGTQSISFIITIGMSDKWQIKRAEPKVLNMKDAWKKRSKDGDNGTPLFQLGREKHYSLGFEDGDKNGQLKEWLRSEQVELRNRVNDILIHYPDNYYDLKKAFENLKPPTEI